MKKMKKIISMFLCCCMIFGLMGTTAVAAGKEELPNKIVAQGFCGTETLSNGTVTGNVWQLSREGVLTITGAYDSRRNPISMPDYTRSSTRAVPWAEYKEDIRAVVITGVLPNIGMNAFWACENLRLVSLPEGLITIGQGAFQSCTSLTTVEIPASVQTIEEYAFYQCDALESIYIYGKDTQLNGTVFLGADRNQLEFYVYEDSKAYEECLEGDLYTVNFFQSGTCGTGMIDKANTWNLIKGVLTITGDYDSQKNPILMPDYSADASNPAPWAEYHDEIESVVIEGVLPNISEGAFSRCTSLISVTIGDKVELIGTDAFYGCSALQSIIIPETVKSIGSHTFEFCAGLEKVTIMGKDTEIGANAFSGCSEDLVIHCLKGSNAQAYAEANGINYELIDETTPVTEWFSDVSEDRWYVDAVQYVFDNGLMGGSNGLFNPDKNITRAQFVTTLHRLAGSPAVSDYSACNLFPDVEEGRYYTEAVCWAYKAGITTGSNGVFNTNGYLTRQQMATFFYRYTDYAGHGTNARGDISSMLNAEKVSPYAKDAIEWAVGVGLISGKPAGTDSKGNQIFDLDPKGNTTRAQQAQVLQRYCESGNIY